jgi:hypothetical protein
MKTATQSPVVALKYLETGTKTVAIEQGGNVPSFWDVQLQTTLGANPAASFEGESKSLLLGFRPDGSP